MIFISTLGSPEYILCMAHSTSVTPASLYTHHRSLTMYLDAVITRIRRCIWRPGSSEPRDTLRGHDRASWRCNWRPRLSELRDALGSHDRVSLEMHREAVMVRVWRCTLRPWASKFADAIGDRYWLNWEMHLEAVIERVWKCSCRLWLSEIGGVLGGGRFGGMHNRNWNSIQWLTCNCGNVESWVQQHLPRDENQLGETVDLGMMLYLVYSVLGVKSWLCHGEIERDDLTLCS